MSNEHRRFTLLGSVGDEVIEGSEMTEEECIICSTKPNGTDVKRAPRKSHLVESLNGIWHYVEALQKNWDSADEHVEEDGIDLSRIFGTQNMYYRTFVKTPCICPPCADKVQVLSDTVNFLKTKLKELRKIVIASKKNEKPLDAAAVVHEALVAAFLRNGSTTTNIQSTSKNVSSTQLHKKYGDLAIKIKNEHPQVETGEWITIEDFQGEEDSLNEDDTNSNFSTDGDDQSWIGSDTEGASSNMKKRTRDRDDDAFGDKDDADCSEASEGEDDISCYENVEDDDGNSKDEEEDGMPQTQTQGNSENTTIKPHNKVLNCHCDITGCGRSFQTKLGLQTHQKRSHPDKHTDGKKYPCTCGKIFTRSHHRSSHFRTTARHKGEELVFGKKRAACDMCGVKETLDKLEKHVREHVGDYAVKCPNANCRYIFTSFVAVPAHLARNKSCRKIIGNETLEYSCETCEFKTYQRYEFRNHLKLYHERDPENRKLHCPISTCAEMFCVRESVHFHLSDKHNMRQQHIQKCVECSQEIKIEEMEQHIKSSHQATQIIQCQLCPFMFSSATREAFLDHLYTHRGNMEALVCDICNDGFKFSRHGALREHYYSAHQIGNKQFVCDQCSKSFFNKANFDKHKMYHAGTLKYNPKSFRCDICPESSVEFKTEESLISHKIKVHGADPFRCKICGTAFSSKSTFLQHEKAHMEIHEKKYECEVKKCGRVFAHKKTLRKHIKFAHEGVRFCCDICGKTYSSAHQLKSHVEISHLKLRPFVCDQCGESFGSPQVLRKHVLIHTGERPFECTVCGQRFRHQVVLKRHMDGHEKKGDSFKPNGPMKQSRKRVVKK